MLGSGQPACGGTATKVATIEVPVVPNLCTSSANFTTFVNLLNTAFDLTVQTINEELGVDFTLPGIPPIPLPGFPSIVIPGTKEAELKRRLHETPGVRGYVGNVFPVDQGGRGLDNNAVFPGFPSFTVEGLPGWTVTGTNPSTHVIQWVNTNYQILTGLLAEEGVDLEVEQIPTVELCGGGSEFHEVGEVGGISPGLVDLVDLVNRNNKKILGNLGACLQAFPDIGLSGGALNEPTWLEAINGGGTRTYTADSVTFSGWSGTINVYNFKVPGATPGTIVDKYDLDWQPWSCGRAFEVTFNYTMTVFTGGPFHSLFIGLSRVHSDDTSTAHVGVTFSRITTGTTTGSHTFTVTAGSFLPSDGVGLRIEAVGGAAADFYVDSIQLTPL